MPIKNRRRYPMVSVLCGDNGYRPDVVRQFVDGATLRPRPGISMAPCHKDGWRADVGLGCLGGQAMTEINARSRPAAQQ
jgi:hypothetical protein